VNAYLVVFAVDKGELELIFRLVDFEDARLGLAIQAEHLVADDFGHVDRQVNRPDNAAVTVGGDG
jgi:hypothetical protein